MTDGCQIKNICYNGAKQKESGECCGKILFCTARRESADMYRKAYEHYFGGIDKYFIPFIKPNQKGKLSSREKNDILPMHNQECARFLRF